MKKVTFSAAILIALVSPLVGAQVNLSEEQLDAIRTNCVNAQVNLQLIQENDRVTRINRGYLYDSTLKLMTNLNSRVALSNLNAPEMISLTSNFESRLNDFRSDYNEYDDTMKSLVSLNCGDQPARFNELLESARQKRSALERHVHEFDALLDSYQTSLNNIKKTVGGEE